VEKVAETLLGDEVQQVIDFLGILHPAANGVLHGRRHVNHPAAVVQADGQKSDRESVNAGTVPNLRNCWAVLRRLVKQGSVRNVEKTLRTKSGERIPVLLSGAVMRDEEHCILGIVCLASDITERKQIERQQQQYETALEGQKQAMEELYGAAEAAARAKSEFLANMSHEIRTPMTAILGYAELINESTDCCTVCPSHSTCETRIQNRTHVQTIRRNGEYLLEIINGILDLSKIEAGKLQVERVACAPGAILADVVSLMRVRADAKRLAISKRLAEMLRGDIGVSSEPGKGSTFTLTIATGPLSGVAMLDRPSRST
jgi:signal transduction histidine kinase